LENQRFPYGEGSEAVELEVLVPVQKCSKCGFEYIDDAAEDIRHEAVCRHLGVLTPDEIREVREEYGFSRAEFSRLSRLGEATLTRWENGSLIQNNAYDQFLRLLRYPENIRRLQVSTTTTARSRVREMATLDSYRFRAIKVEPGLREEQRIFRLHIRQALAA
jgi:putative zinc finger/helix-turn-helix YgiT family protein